MRFLQPLLFYWGLPIVLLPILIHLLNRLRYRSVKWAAMMFLLSATRSSVRRARLKHWLILACRTLLLFFLLFALSRPVVGGWLGRTGAGSPETVIILLDRSASMETIEPKQQKSRRLHALGLLAHAEDTLGYSSQFVLIESVFMKPQEVAGISAIAEMSMASATDTAADIPAMLNAAQNYMIQNRTGRTEIWIVSDMQRSNWHPESSRWASLNAQMASLPQDLFIRVLSLSGGQSLNAAVSLTDDIRRSSDSSSRISLNLQLTGTEPRTDAFPLTLSIDGQRSQIDTVLKQSIMQITHDMEITSDADEFGWGKAEIPADGNTADNTCYFTYSRMIELSAAVLAEDKVIAKPLSLAAAPSDELPGLSASSGSPLELDDLDTSLMSLLIYQASGPGSDFDTAVMTFVKTGGSVLLLPPTSPDTEGVLGITWRDVETAPDDQTYRVSTWDTRDGLLADTADGSSLPVGALKILQRRLPVEAEEQNEWFALANFSDGAPFLLRRRIGRGQAFAITTVPNARWSNLSDGRVLVPMIQRAMQMGGRRLSNVSNEECGRWTPPKGTGPWRPEHGSEQSNPRWRSGVYRWKSKLIALNRPISEDSPEIIDTEDAGNLLGENRVHITEGLSETRPDAVQSEIGHIMLYLALACIVLETALLATAWRKTESK